MAKILVVAELTDEQKKRVDAKLQEGGHSISHIACKLSLTKSLVQSYVQSQGR